MTAFFVVMLLLFAVVRLCLLPARRPYGGPMVPVLMLLVAAALVSWVIETHRWAPVWFS